MNKKMKNHEITINSYTPIKLSKTIFSFDMIRPKMDFSYQILSELNLCQRDMHRNIFIGTHFRDIVFDKIDLTRGDFQAARFEKCKFIECNFSISDFKASDFGDVEFIRSNFESCSITDCIFSKCQFIECDLEKASFIECRTELSIFESTSLSKGQSILNHFTQTHFEKMHLADCTYDKNIFTKCTFNQCNIDIFYLGMLIGISRQDIQKMKLIHQNDDTTLDSPIDDVIAKIDEEYRIRGMLLSSAIFRLNFRLTPSLYEAFRGVQEAISVYITSDIIVKREEITFLCRVLQYYFDASQLPLLAILEFYECIDELITSRRKINQLSLIALHSLKNKLIELLNASNKQLDELLDYPPLPFNNERLYLRLTYTIKPEFPINPFMDKIAAIAFSTEVLTKPIASYEGSFIEVVETTIAYLGALRMMLFFINGSFKQVSVLIDTVGTIRTQISKFPQVKSIEKSFGMTRPSRGLIPAMNIFKYMKGTDMSNRLMLSKDLAYLDKVEMNTDCDFQRPASPKKKRSKASINV